MTEICISSHLLLPVLAIFPQYWPISGNKLLLQDPAMPNSLMVQPFKGFRMRGVQNAIFWGLATSHGLIQTHLYEF